MRSFKLLKVQNPQENNHEIQPRRKTYSIERGKITNYHSTQEVIKRRKIYLCGTGRKINKHKQKSVNKYKTLALKKNVRIGCLNTMVLWRIFKKINRRTIREIRQQGIQPSENKEQKQGGNYQTLEVTEVVKIK